MQSASALPHHRFVTQQAKYHLSLLCENSAMFWQYERCSLLSCFAVQWLVSYCQLFVAVQRVSAAIAEFPADLLEQSALLLSDVLQPELVIVFSACDKSLTEHSQQ
jgi:hypothetical protein